MTTATKTIERLTVALERAQRIQGKRGAAIKAALQTEWNKVFSADKDLQSAITALESSREWGNGEVGIYRYVPFYGVDDYAECREFLEAYLADQGIHIEGESLVASEGPSFIINDEGDVYDQDSCKVIIERADYLTDEGEEDEAKRNALIEAYMEETGFFPGVFRSDGYGNVFLVDTIKAGV